MSQTHMDRHCSLTTFEMAAFASHSGVVQTRTRLHAFDLCSARCRAPPRVAKNSPQRHASPLCMKFEPHPYGDGGIDNKVDWTGYDRGRVRQEYLEAKDMYEEFRRTSAPDALLSEWCLIFNTDLIMWNNNLMKDNIEYGTRADFDRVIVLRIPQQAADECYETKLKQLWVLRLRGGSNILSIGYKNVGNVTLCWPDREAAEVFAEHMRAEGHGTLDAYCAEVDMLRDNYKRFGAFIGYVAPSLVLPRHFANAVE